MIWVVSLIIALVAYFLFQGLHARHISRCHTDNRTAEHVPDSLGLSKEHATFHEQSAASAAQAQLQRGPAPHNAPSLLYADRKSGGKAIGGAANNNAAREQLRNDQMHASRQQQRHTDSTHQTSTQHANTQCTTDDKLDMDLDSNSTADSTMEFTSEQVPVSDNDVGIPANSSEYADRNQSGSHKSSNAGIATAGAAAATVAGVAAASTSAASSHSEFDTGSSQHAATSARSAGSGTSENIDLELGDSDNTYNDAEDIEGNNHDELLDFGDLTSDISDMLKELNLRESDSPRLEINKAEFEQLKTGEPGEVKPAKIENVADKLRNMLQ